MINEDELKLKKDFDILHRDVVDMIINFCKEHYLDCESVNLNISNIEGSLDYGIWMPSTNSSMELVSIDNEPIVISS